MKYVKCHVLTDSPQSRMTIISNDYMVCHYSLGNLSGKSGKTPRGRKHPLLILSKCEINVPFLSDYML